MNTESPATPPVWPRRLLGIGLWLLGMALVLLILDGPLYRIGVLPLVPALLALVLATVLLILSFPLLLAGVIATRSRNLAPSGALPIVALVACGALVLNFGLLMQRTFSVPPIHDISTDLDDPPDFADVVALRKRAGAVNPPEYLREAPGRSGTINVPDAQRKAYPDIRPVRVQMAPAQTFAVADGAAREMGWDIVASVPAEGRIEATDTTRYFGFKDDVSIRVRADGAGSKVDMRSKSRVGVGDAGKNAARIRDYMKELGQRQGSGPRPE